MTAMPQPGPRTAGAASTAVAAGMYDASSITVLEGLDAMIRSDLSTTLAEVRVPVLVVSGAADPARPANSEALCRGLPDARAVVIEGAGADVVRDQPAALAAALRDFLDS